MTIIYYSDLVPVLISGLVFSFLATAHRVLIPNKYSAFLQFKEEEDVNKTIQSTSIRIIYLIVGTSTLHLVLGYSEKQITIGVFIACFLNIWPAIIQYQLLKLRKTKTEWLVLVGYIAFVVFSCSIVIVSIRMFLPILYGDTSIYWLDNQAISLVMSIIAMAIPIPIEACLAKFTHITIVLKIDTFVEEVYILEKQLNMSFVEIKRNKYYIDDAAMENDINVKLLEIILKLEIIYRGKLYYYLLEKFVCKRFGELAIRKNISVGLAQIRVSTAQKILRENPQKFIRELCDDKFNIFLCAKLLKFLIDEYNDMIKMNDEYYLEKYEDVFDYIACEYLGTYPDMKTKTALLYSAVLRSTLENEALYYLGSDEMKKIKVCMKSGKKKKVSYSNYLELKDTISKDILIRKELFIDGKSFELEFECTDSYNIEVVRNFAKEYHCSIEIKDV